MYKYILISPGCKKSIHRGYTHDPGLVVGGIGAEGLAAAEEVIRSEAALVDVAPLLQAHGLALPAAQALQAAQPVIVLPRALRRRLRNIKAASVSAGFFNEQAHRGCVNV